MSKAASDHTGGAYYARVQRIGTTSSISGSVSGGDKGWSEQKPHYMLNEPNQPMLELANQRLDQPRQPQQLTPKGLGTKADFTNL